jgi:hypothetical protein bfra3_13555|nr:MAG TPA: tail protein [Caudoviricetes sp.]
MELKIYNQQGVLKATVSPSDSDRHVKEVMNDNVLNLSFTLYEYVGLGVNDYVDFDGERFTLLEDYKPEQNSTVEYVYNCKFYGIESELKKAKVLKLVDNENELSFSYDATAAEHLQLICDNINRIKGGNAWVIGEVVSTGNVNIEYDNIFCFDALSEIAKNFDTEWWIEGSTINLSRCEHGTAVSLGYGKGLKKLTRVANDTVPFFTRLYPLGSTRNIVQSDYGYKRLQLPGGVRYVEKNTYLGIVEQSEENFFSNIYPRRTGKVSTVRSMEATGEDGNKFTIYYFTDSSLDFDPNDYEIEGLVKNVVFQSGELNGRDFELNFNSKTKEFEIVTQFPYENQQLPGGLLIPKPGDEYILYNIRMPKEYYPLAEQEFAEAVAKYMDKISIDTSVYKAPTDYVYLEENRISLQIGRRVLLENEIYFPAGAHESRITKISRKLNNPFEADIECTYAVDYGRISQIENNIVDIQAAYKEQLNKEVLAVLKSWDSIDPTEYNVLSAVRTIKAIANSISRLEKEISDKFLRKDIPDEAGELETFLKGISVIGTALVEKLTVDKNAFFKDTLSSENFISGFPGGSGWALFWKEVINAAGVTEKKAVMELDDMTIRGVMRVYEFVISQLVGENGTRITSDMMRVHSINPATKTIYLDTEKGVLYNPFRAGDIVMVQQFSVNGHGGKQYEFEVVDAKVGALADGENRLDSVTYKNFVGDVGSVAARDVLTRVDSLTNSDRKGILKQTSVEEGSPYLDVLYGMKTDPDNAVRTRLGRLAGIITYCWGQLKGYGLYSENAYLTGDFRLRTGEDVRTKFEIVEGMLQSAMQGVINTMTEKDNYLTNATFQDDLTGWIRENDISIYDVNGQLLDLGINFYSEKNKVSDVVSFDGCFMLRVKRSYIKQLNKDITKPEKGSILYLTIKYHCDAGGTLTAGFSGSAPYVSKAIEAADGFQVLEVSGEWSGSGDFLLQFTGDIYIERLTLTNHPLEDYQKVVSTKFEQTAERISAVAEVVDKIDNTIKTAGWITTADGNKLWATISTVDSLGNRLITHESSFHVTAEQINAIVSRIDKAEDDLGIIDSTIKTAGWITTADGNKLWATIDRVDVLGNRLTTHESSFHVTAQQINAIVSRVDTIDGTISKAGWITSADGNRLWASKSLENGGTIVSFINQSAEDVVINSEHIKLEGLVTANEYFKVLEDGSIEANAGTFSGYLKTNFHLVESSDAIYTTDSARGEYGYRINKELSLKVDMKGATDGANIILSNDVRYIGSRVILYNGCHPPYTRTVGSIRYSSVCIDDGSLIRGTNTGLAEDDLLSYIDPYKIEWISGIIELIGTPEYNGREMVKLISWRGELEQPPTNPQSGWLYYNEKENRNYLYWYGEWVEFPVYGDESEDLRITWLGVLSSSPKDPKKNSIYMTTWKYLYIYTGEHWKEITYGFDFLNKCGWCVLGFNSLRYKYYK